MAALASLSIADSVPTTRTFAVVDHGPSFATWRYDNGAPIAGQPYVGINKLRDDQNSRKVRCKTVLPVMETIGAQNASGYTAPPKVAFFNTVSSDYTINKRSTALQTNDVCAFHVNFLGTSAATDPTRLGLFAY